MLCHHFSMFDVRVCNLRTRWLYQIILGGTPSFDVRNNVILGEGSLIPLSFCDLCKIHFVERVYLTYVVELKIPPTALKSCDPKRAWPWNISRLSLKSNDATNLIWSLNQTLKHETYWPSIFGWSCLFAPMILMFLTYFQHCLNVIVVAQFLFPIWPALLFSILEL